MSKFLTGPELTRAIASLTEFDSVDMAVAFWGRDACQRLGLSTSKSSLRVVCDARSGACNPKTVKELLKLGAKIVDLPRLHAKVYIASSSVIVCSANASANGLGEEGAELEANFEAGYLSERQEDILAARTWFDRVFTKGSPLDEADLPELERLWKSRSASRPLRGETFLAVMLSQPERLKNRNFKVIFYAPVDPPKKYEDKYKQTPFFDRAIYGKLRDYPFYWGTERWKVTTNDYILDFEVNQGTPLCNGVWRVQGLTSGGGIVPVERISKPFGLAFPMSEQRKIARLAKAYISDHGFDEGKLIDGADFAVAVAQADRPQSARTSGRTARVRQTS